MIREAKKQLEDPSLVAIRVAWRLRTRLHLHLTVLSEIFDDVTSYCADNMKGRGKLKLAYELMLQLISIFADHEYDDRSDVREALLLTQEIADRLNPQSYAVPRELYFFEYTNAVVPFGQRGNLHKKMFYVMNMVAGWRLDNSEQCDWFIDMPLLAETPFADNTILAEAVYRLQDERIMLEALRCGAAISGILLWPIGMVLDLHRALDVPLDMEGKEAMFIRYFCRARRWIWLGLMPVTSPRPQGLHLPEDICRNDILLLPENASYLVPEDRYKQPASLKHQCRLTIRDALLRADHLPDGPNKLPLPTILKEYVDLRMD